MIYDSLDNAGIYMGMHPALDTALTYLENCDTQALQTGPLPIEGEAFYGNVMEVTHTQTRTWESHQCYADIQLSLTGTETIEYLHISQVEGWGPYKEDSRLSSSGQTGIPLPMHKRFFCVFFPWDAHSPNQGAGQGRKLVLKVKWQ